MFSNVCVCIQIYICMTQELMKTMKWNAQINEKIMHKAKQEEVCRRVWREEKEGKNLKLS